MAQSHYFDPDTGIISMYKDYELECSSGQSKEFGLGLSDFSELTDVKVKVLSIEYKVKMFTDNNSAAGTPSADNNVYAFNNEERQAGGNVVFGVRNEADTTIYYELDLFTGSSAWPVHMTSWVTQVGLPASASKTWKPRKLALSDEQKAFITVRNNSGVYNSQSNYSWASIMMRVVRL